jgi:PAS domain S-box-containing protein
MDRTVFTDRAGTLITGNSEMACRIRAFDWSKTPLGRIEEWSETLLAIANLMLHSPFPTILSWGPELVFLYNDAAISTLTVKHPKALGGLYREVFHEAWDLVGDDVKACFYQGKTAVRDNMFIPILIDGALEDHYWSYSLIPVYENGRIGGVYDAFRNMTASVVGAQRLRESEARLKLATEVAKLGVFVWYIVEDIWSWENDRIYEIFGRSREDGSVTRSKFLRDVVHPDYRDLFRKAVQRTVQNGEPLDFEGMICLPDETLRRIEIKGSLQPESDASKSRILGTVRDITEVRKNEEALRESAKHLGELAAIVDSSEDVILSKDLNGIITSWNAAAIRVFGYSPEEMIGQSILKLIPEHLHSDEETIIASIRAGNRVEHFETVRVTKNGKLLDVSVTVSPVKDSHGNVIGASKILRDISARKRAEQTHLDLSKRLAQLAAIVESSDDVILSKSLDGIITSWNAAAVRVFGYSAEEMIGQSILKLIPEHLHSDEKEIIENIRAGRRMEHFDTVRMAKDGRLIDVSLTISPIFDADGRVTGASKILRDVSARKRMEQSLLQAEKIAATGRMAATIAHEINNPLEAVVNLLFLLRPMVTTPDGVNYLASAERELARVSHIAKQTLGYYREHASASRACLSDIAEHAIEIYEPRCMATGIALRKSHESSRKVMLRRGEMMQVISNLISNSMYSMPTGGTLSISVRDTDDPSDGVVLTVADDGVGIRRKSCRKCSTHSSRRVIRLVRESGCSSPSSSSKATVAKLTSKATTKSKSMVRPYVSSCPHTLPTRCPEMMAGGAQSRGVECSEFHS